MIKNHDYYVYKRLLTHDEQKALLIECAKAMYEDTGHSWWRQLAKELDISDVTVRKFLSSARPTSIPAGIWCDVYNLLVEHGTEKTTAIAKRMKDTSFINDPIKDYGDDMLHW